MPQMGESIVEGTITKWMKNVGDHVDRDEPLFEISTDKVDAEIPSPAAGTLTEVRYKEGETVEVNTVVAVLDSNAAAASAEAAVAPAEPAKPEPSITVERPKPVITNAPAPTAPTSHKTEVKPLIKKGEAPKVKAASAPERSADGGDAAELRRTKSSPLVRKIAS